MSILYIFLKSIALILPQNTQIFITHYIASFYLHTFPTWLVYVSVNSLAYSVKSIPSNSPSPPNAQNLAQVSSGTHPMW